MHQAAPHVHYIYVAFRYIDFSRAAITCQGLEKIREKFGQHQLTYVDTVAIPFRSTALPGRVVAQVAPRSPAVALGTGTTGTEDAA